MSSGRSDIAERKRAALGRAALVLLVFLPYPILATLTPVLDGTVGGVSVAYLVGFLVIDVRARRGADAHRRASPRGAA